jgi:hypothetical protein
VGEVGGLERALQDGDGVVLGGDVVEGLGAAGGSLEAAGTAAAAVCRKGLAYYFSTQGCRRAASLSLALDLELEPFALAAAAAAFSAARALLLKKFDILD